MELKILPQVHILGGRLGNWPHFTNPSHFWPTLRQVWKKGRQVKRSKTSSILPSRFTVEPSPRRGAYQGCLRPPCLPRQERRWPSSLLLSGSKVLSAQTKPLGSKLFPLLWNQKKYVKPQPFSFLIFFSLIYGLGGGMSHFFLMIFSFVSVLYLYHSPFIKYCTIGHYILFTNRFLPIFSSNEGGWLIQQRPWHQTTQVLKKRVSFYFHFVLILLGSQQLKPPSQPVWSLGSYLAASSPTNLAVSTFS